MKKEYEIIRHDQMHGLEIFLIQIIERNLHGHADMEFGILLEGSVELLLENKSIILKKNDIYLINRYQIHAFHNHGKENLILAFQLDSSLYKGIDYSLLRAQFEDVLFQSGALHSFLYKKLLLCAKDYFYAKPHYELLCTSHILSILYEIASHATLNLLNEKEHDALRHNALRINRISEYISEHYADKISLQEIADLEKITLYHASHYIKKAFGITFQEYLNNIRFEHALHLIQNSHLSILDICLETGFSNSRYLNRIFEERFAMTIRTYRQNAKKIPEIVSVLPTSDRQKRLPFYRAKTILEPFFQSLGT